MPAKQLEAALVISASAKNTQAVFDKVGAQLDRLAVAGKRVGGVGRDFINVASQIDRMGDAVARAGRNVDKLHSKMRQVDTLGRRLGNALKPLAAGYAGYESARVARSIMENTARAAVAGQHERVRMEAAGMHPGEREEGEKLAADLSAKYPALSQTTLLHMLRNTRSVVGSFEDAARVMEPLAKLRILAEGAHPERKEELETEFDQLTKGVEIKGAVKDPVEFTRYMQGMARALNVFGDTLRPTDFYQMFKYGGVGVQGLSEQFMLETAPTFAQELGGSRTGVALSMFYSKLVGDTMSLISANELKKFGLIDMSKVQSKAGRVTKLHPGAVTGWELAALDPFRWVNEIFLPALAKHGVTDKQKILAEIATVFGGGKQSSGAFVSILATQQWKILKNQLLSRGAQGLEAADAFMNKDVTVAWGAVTEQTKNFLQVAGGPLALPAAHSLKAIADSIAYLAQAARNHPAAQSAATMGLLGSVGVAGLAAYESVILAARLSGMMNEWTARSMARAPLRLGPLIPLAIGGYGALDYLRSKTSESQSGREVDRSIIASMPWYRRAAIWTQENVFGADPNMLVPELHGGAGMPAKAEVSGELKVHVVADLPEWLHAYVEDGEAGVRLRGSTGDMGKNWSDLHR